MKMPTFAFLSKELGEVVDTVLGNGSVSDELSNCAFFARYTGMDLPAHGSGAC